jgi:hypothetical protein
MRGKVTSLCPTHNHAGHPHEAENAFGFIRACAESLRCSERNREWLFRSEMLDHQSPPHSFLIN